MNSRLKDDLNSFLIQYDLTMDARIFEESLPQLAGIEDFDKSRLIKFRFLYTNQHGCTLAVPVKISEQDKVKLFAFYHAPLENLSNKTDENEEDDSYVSSNKQHMLIQEAHLVDKVIPAFKSHIEYLAMQDNNPLKPYQLKSRRILANEALEKTGYLCEASLALLNKNNVISEHGQFLSLLLLQLKGLTSELSSGNHYVYPYLAGTIEKMEACMSTSGIQAHPKINKKMSLLFQSLESYLRYNDVEACLRSDKIYADLNQFLFDKKISIHDCDIFENTLLELAGVNEYGRCKIDQDHADAARMKMTVGALSQENAEKFLQFFHECGAKSAVITFSCFQRERIEHDGDSEDDGPYAVMRLPSVQFNIDNQEITKLVLPAFYQRITELVISDPSKLIPYQKRSRDSFKNEKPVLTNNPAQLFHVKKEATQEVNELAQGCDHDSNKSSISLSKSQ